MRKPSTIAFLLLISLSTLRAEEQSAIPSMPDEDSPFFVLREGERREEAQTAEALKTYPMNKGSEDTSGAMLSRFFTNTFSSIKIGRKNTETKTALVVEPSEFSLEDRRELTVNFSVANRTRKLLKLDFPTSQRVEIIVRDPSGKVIERWSDDRAFDQVPGVVMVNANERIEYVEKVPTREMRPGIPYVIEASLANNPSYVQSATVTPKIGAKPAQPQPAFPER